MANALTGLVDMEDPYRGRIGKPKLATTDAYRIQDSEKINGV